MKNKEIVLKKKGKLYYSFGSKDIDLNDGLNNMIRKSINNKLYFEFNELYSDINNNINDLDGDLFRELR